MAKSVILISVGFRFFLGLNYPSNSVLVYGFKRELIGSTEISRHLQELTLTMLSSFRCFIPSSLFQEVHPVQEPSSQLTHQSKDHWIKLRSLRALPFWMKLPNENSHSELSKNGCRPIHDNAYRAVVGSAAYPSSSVWADRAASTSDNPSTVSSVQFLFGSSTSQLSGISSQQSLSFVEYSRNRSAFRTTWTSAEVTKTKRSLSLSGLWVQFACGNQCAIPF